MWVAPRTPRQRSVWKGPPWEECDLWLWVQPVWDKSRGRSQENEHSCLLFSDLPRLLLSQRQSDMPSQRTKEPTEVCLLRQDREVWRMILEGAMEEIGHITEIKVGHACINSDQRRSVVWTKCLSNLFQLGSLKKISGPPNNLFWASRKILNLFCDWIFKVWIPVILTVQILTLFIFDSEYSLVWIFQLVASGGGLPSPPTEEASLGAPSGCAGGFRQTSCWSPQGTLGTGSVDPHLWHPRRGHECTLLLQVGQGWAKQDKGTELAGEAAQDWRQKSPCSYHSSSFLLLVYNCFEMCLFLLYNKVNQL